MCRVLWHVHHLMFCKRCVVNVMLPCFVSVGLFLVALVQMAPTPASMCTPLKTLNDSLSHRRRYMVREWWHACKYVSVNVETLLQSPCPWRVGGPNLWASWRDQRSGSECTKQSWLLKTNKCILNIICVWCSVYSKVIFRSFFHFCPDNWTITRTNNNDNSDNSKRLT